MKLKELKKVIYATKIEITAKNYNNHEYYTFHIDYFLSEKECEKNAIFEYCYAFSLIPDEIMNREVKHISINSANNELSISC